MNNINDFKTFEYNKDNIGEVLYHFVDNFALGHILETDCLVGGVNDMRDVVRGRYALSFTRKYDFPWKNIRLAIDHRLLAQNYRLVPVHFFNAQYSEPGYDVRDLSDERNKHHDTGNGRDFRNQFEIRLITNNDPNVPLDRYLLGVDICTNQEKSTFPGYYRGDLTPESQAEAIQASFDVPVTIVDEFKPFPFYPLDQKYTKVWR